MNPDTLCMSGIVVSATTEEALHARMSLHRRGPPIDRPFFCVGPPSGQPGAMDVKCLRPPVAGVAQNGLLRR